MRTFFLICSLLLAFSYNTIAQVVNPPQVEPDSQTSIQVDSLLLESQNISDTLKTATNKVKRQSGPKKSSIDKKIERSASDSVTMDMKTNKMFYYGDATVKYEDIEIKAAFMELDMKNHTVRATGMPDSTGKIQGRPEFKQGKDTYLSDEMIFNFDTQKGIITKVFTEENEGYIHGDHIKKMSDGSINLKGGSFTTCDLREHPHFEFRFTKARVIPDDMIVTGPIFITIEEVPLPIGLPFALLPNRKGQKSGFIMPSYGEEANRGFFLKDIGWYFIISEHMDLQLTGSIFTRGSWGLSPKLRYIERYRHTGTLDFAFAHNVVGTVGASDYYKGNGYKIKWTHKQDPKARPNSSFSASVYMVSPKYNAYNATTTGEFLSNEFNSSIAYQTNIAKKVYITLNASQSQNTITRNISFTLPELTVTVNRFYPLINVGKKSKNRWYKDFNMNYVLNAKNTISMADSLYFPSFSTPDWSNVFQDYWQNNWMNNLKNGIQHKLPINLPVKIMKHFTLTTSINLTDRMYFDYQQKEWIAATDSTSGYVSTTTERGFRNVFSYDLSARLTTKIYGMKYFKKGYIRAVRHVITPSIDFNYIPDFSNASWNYYQYYLDQNNEQVLYNMFANGMYGSPGSASAGRLNYSFGNNLEIKVPSKSDTVTGLKTVKLIDNLTLSGNYDIMKDSLNFSTIAVSGRTTLFKKLNLQYSSILDPYVNFSTGNRWNQFEFERSRHLFNKTSSTWNISLSYSFGNDNFKKGYQNRKNKTKTATENAFKEEYFDLISNIDNYIDWETPWKITLSYNFRYSNSIKYLDFVGTPNNKVIQTLSASGDITPTPNWKIAFQTGWDFETNKLSYTSLNIHRDLHCFEMSFNWIPIGNYKSWNFVINIKASALKDIKLPISKSYLD